jgi:3-hydroxyacyl-[acyl-carrier-protein] dehydratase
MLQIHRVLDVGEDRVVCESDLDDNWVFPLHFPGAPIFPGSLLIEGAGQTIAIWAWEKGMRGDPRLVRVQAEFRSPVVPGDRVLTYRATIKKRCNLCVGTVDVMANDREVARVHGSLMVAIPAALPQQSRF